MEQINYLTLAEASKLLPGRPHPSCIWRWCRKGVWTRGQERVRLQHRRLGSRIFVTPEWIEQFGRQLAEADAKHFELAERVQSAALTESPSCRRRRRSSRQHSEHASLRDQQNTAAEKELDDAGVR